MDLILKRSGSLPLRDQLVVQIEIKILAGELPSGQRLPSVRSLARRLRIHPNTVSAAYRRLAVFGHLECEHGSGVFVRRGAPAPQVRRSFEEAVHQALALAVQQGLGAEEIRSAVERWLRAAPPGRVVVLDTNRETAELLAHEVRERVTAPVSWSTLEAAARDPRRLHGALAVSWPYHLEAVARCATDGKMALLTLAVSPGDTHALESLAAGALVLIISHSPRVLHYALGLLAGVRGDDVTIQCFLDSEPGQWRGLLAAADLVYADAVSAPAVTALRPRGVREFRILAEESHLAIRRGLTLSVPEPRGGAAERGVAVRAPRGAGRTR